MLFKFGIFWKGILTLLISWGFYGLFGFEMTVVTLLAVLIIKTLKPDTILL
jgi:hypothetical protein|tara:strand:+ start:1535 stop:1687 length:153 start_codon:yes stop_codon:yes gene_type:complete